jgi:hypothetical protein
VPPRFTDHALEACERRGIAVVDVLRVLSTPDDIQAQDGRQILQSTLPLPPEGKSYLVRVVVEGFGEDTVVVTAYRTTKFAKYGATS